MVSMSRPQKVVHLTRKAVAVWTAGLMALVGLTFSGAAAAAGVTGVDVLAMLFFMGAAGALFLLIVWYLLQPRSV